MRLRRAARPSAIAVGIGVSLMTGSAFANATPPSPCNPPSCQGPGGPSTPAQQGGPGGLGGLSPQVGPGGLGGPQPQGGPGNQGPQGGPGNLPPGGWKTPGNGAPPPPPDHGAGWNDGLPPGGPPPGWNGPPPPGGWNGPPPPGGWNRHWDGPPRDIDQARLDHQPFDYDDYYANPIYEPDFGGWGFWFFGIWIPL